MLIVNARLTLLLILGVIALSAFLLLFDTHERKPLRLISPSESVASTPKPENGSNETEIGSRPIQSLSLYANVLLRGQVIDDLGRPLQGVSVRVPDARTSVSETTDRFGEFHFSCDVRTGSPISMTATKTGYVANSVELQQPFASDTTIRVMRAPDCPHVVRIQVIDEVRNPVVLFKTAAVTAGATKRSVLNEHGEPILAEHDTNDGIAILSLPFDTADIVVYCAARSPATLYGVDLRTASPDYPVDHTVMLGPGAEAYGSVTLYGDVAREISRMRVVAFSSGLGKPVEVGTQGIRGSLFLDSAAKTQSVSLVLTDHVVPFAIKGLSPGAYKVAICDLDGVLHGDPVRIEVQGEESVGPIALSLHLGTAVEVQVQFSGVPLHCDGYLERMALEDDTSDTAASKEGAHPSRQYVQRATTAQSGVLVFESMPPGVYRLRLNLARYAAHHPLWKVSPPLASEFDGLIRSVWEGARQPPRISVRPGAGNDRIQVDIAEDLKGFESWIQKKGRGAVREDLERYTRTSGDHSARLANAGIRMEEWRYYGIERRVSIIESLVAKGRASREQLGAGLSQAIEEGNVRAMCMKFIEAERRR
jgi:hypothetical protein